MAMMDYSYGQHQQSQNKERNDSRKKHNRPSNKGTALLEAHENETLFKMLGTNNYTLASGVAQLLLAQPPTARQWVKHCTGVICFVKDYAEKAYFIRMFDIHRQRQLWQQMLYEDFKINKPHRVLVTFEAEDCVAGLNFSDESEAIGFKNAIDRRIQQALKAPSNKRMSSNYGGDMPPPPPSQAPPSVPPQSFQNLSSTTGVVAPYDSKPNNFLSTYNSNNMALGKGTIGKGGKRKLGKISKDDISLPTDFRHQVHVGWNPEKGFEQSTDVENSQDPSIKELLAMLGFNGLKKGEQKFIKKFIAQQYGDIESVQEVLKQEKAIPPPPPPQRAPPTRQPTATFSPQTGPPPPPRDPPMTVRNTGPPANRPLPSVPIPPVVPVSTPKISPPRPPTQSPPPPVGIPPPPPPPPPPPLSGAPPPPPPPAPLGASHKAGPPPAAAPAGGERSNLLDEIRRGVQLKTSSGDGSSENGGDAEPTDTRDALLSQIKGKVNLKKVDNTQPRPSSVPPEQLGGIAGALARALQERRNQLVESDASSDDDDDDRVEKDDEEWSD